MNPNDLQDQVRRLAQEMSQPKPDDPDALNLQEVDIVGVYETIARQNHEMLVGVTGVDCPTCHGTGFVVLSGNNRDYCTAGCEAAHTLRQKNFMNTLQSFGHIPSVYATYTFDSWYNDVHPNLQRGKRLAAIMAEYIAYHTGGVFDLLQVLQSDLAQRRLGFAATGALKDGQEYVQLWDKDQIMVEYPNVYGHSLVLASEQVGTGKSGLMVAAAKVLLQRRVSVAFVHLPTLLKDTRTAYENSERRGRRDDPVGHGKTYDELMHPVRAAQVLLIDDAKVIGDTSRNDVTVMENDVLINRWEANKVTIMTTNHTQESFANQWGNRLASRVFNNFHWVDLQGGQVRRQHPPIKGF